MHDAQADTQELDRRAAESNLFADQMFDDLDSGQCGSDLSFEDDSEVKVLELSKFISENVFRTFSVIPEMRRSRKNFRDCRLLESFSQTKHSE